MHACIHTSSILVALVRLSRVYDKTSNEFQLLPFQGAEVAAIHKKEEELFEKNTQEVLREFIGIKERYEDVFFLSLKTN